MPRKPMQSNLQVTMTHGGTTQHLCVLAGSMGAPGSIKRFFGNLRQDLPVTFLVALHISSEAVALLCDFVNRSTSMRVLPAQPGHTLMHGEVVVMPMDRQLQFTSDGKLELLMPEEAITNPIDQILRSVAVFYGRRSGAIIFSGIGEDGSRGCTAMNEYGSEIWVQSDESCRFSSMPHYIHQSCDVVFSGTPEQLATRLNAELTNKHSRSGNALAG